MKKLFSLFLFAALLAAMLAGCDAAVPVSSAPSSSEVQAVSSEPEETPSPEPEPTPEATPEATPVVNTGDKPDFGPLSDDLYSYQIQIDEDVYQFPMTYDDFLSFGWTYDADETTEIGPNQYTTSNRASLGELQVYTQSINFDVNTKPISESYIGGFSVDASQAKKSPDTKFILPKGIEHGVATAEQVKETYGTPTYENTTDSGRTTIEYSDASYQKVRLVFDADTGLLDTIELRNFAEPEDFETGEVSAEVPAVVGKYQAPAAASDDFSEFIVEYGGKLYQLPAPVSEFEADGWVIQEADTEMTISGKQSGWVTMLKDNQKLRVMAKNYSDGATAVNNTFITKVVGSDRSGEQTPITIAKGITIGITKAELETAIAGVEFEETDGSSYYHYKIMPLDSITEKYEVYVSKENDKVYKIEASYSPKFSDYTGG